MINLLIHGASGRMGKKVYENAVNFFSNLIDEFDKESDK